VDVDEKRAAGTIKPIAFPRAPPVRRLPAGAV
jgi:hypothetical protein